MLNQEFKRARASFGDGDALKRKSHMVSGSVSDEAQTVKSLVAVVKVAKKHLLKMKRTEEETIGAIHFESQISKSNNNKNKARRVKFQKQETDAELKLKTFRDEYLKEPLQLYSEFSCLLLITRMHDRLPRELRDLIYAHIWTPSYLRKNCTPIVTAFQGIQGYGDVHVLDADFVGVEIGREILEALYKADPMPIQPFSAYNPYDVERLMLNDIFGLYVEPAKMLRKMDIELDLHDLTFQTPKHGDVGFMEMNEIKECLHTLLEVEKKRKFKLSFKLKQRRVRLNDCPRWFDVLKPILEAFEKEGADVKINWSYTGTEWAEHKVRKPLNNLIKSHPNNPDWKTTVIQELDMEHRIRDRHREYLEEDSLDYDEDGFISDEGSDDYLGPRL